MFKSNLFEIRIHSLRLHHNWRYSRPMFVLLSNKVGEKHEKIGIGYKSWTEHNWTQLHRTAHNCTTGITVWVVLFSIRNSISEQSVAVWLNAISFLLSNICLYKTYTYICWANVFFWITWWDKRRDEKRWTQMT